MHRRILYTSHSKLVYSGSVFFTRLLAALSSLVLSLVTVRELHADQAGLFFLAMTIATVTASLARGGIERSVLRHAAISTSRNSYKALRELTVRIVLISGISTVLCAALLYVFAEPLSIYVFMKPALIGTIKWFAPASVALSILAVSGAALQGAGCVIRSVFIQTLSANVLLILLFQVLPVREAEDAASLYAISSVISIIFAGCFLVSLFVRKSENTRHAIDWQSLYASSLPLWLIVVAQQFSVWGGQLVAGVYVSAENLAVLAVTQRIAQVVNFVLIVSNLLTAPLYASLHDKNKISHLQSVARRSTKVTALMAMPVLVVLLLFPEWILGFFGEDYISGKNLLRILALAQFINVATGSVGYLLTMCGYEKDLRNSTLWSSCVGLFLAFLLTPVLGTLGSAIATAITIVSSNLIAAFWVNRRIGFDVLALDKLANKSH